MTFSEFANLLHPILANGRNTADFTRELLFSIVDFPGGNEADNNPISNVTDPTLKAYFNGTRGLTKLAQTVNSYIDIYKFEGFLEDVGDDAITRLCDLMAPYCGEIHPGNVSIKIAELFQVILEETATIKRKAKVDITSVTNNENESARIVSFVVPPVSKENYVARPNIERDISRSLHANKITVIRGLSGLGKSELARKVATDEIGFSTVIRLELGNDGSGDIETLLDSQVSIIDIPKNKDSLACKKALLRTAGQDFLVVVDNLNNINNYSFLQSLANSTGSAKILITSQIQEAKLNDFCRSFRIQASVIDLEMDKYSHKEFAPMVFCSYAGLVYDDLTVDEQSAVQAICNHVAGHTMIVAALGLRMKKYGDYARKLLITMVEDVDNCMTNIRVKLQKDMAVTRSLTAYEILKGLSISLLQRNYTERERQVLGAVILLPHGYKRRDTVAELVGDIIEADCFEANDAIETLCDDGVLQITTEGDIVLHPLYAQLCSDLDIAFYNKKEERKQGPIAETSTDYAFHLLRNVFVSTSKIKWHDVLRLFREIGVQMGMGSTEKYVKTAPYNYGWLAICAKKYGPQEIEYLKKAVAYNHNVIDYPAIVSDHELEDVLMDNFKKDSTWPSGFGDYGASLAKLDSHRYCKWHHPNHPSILSMLEGDSGRSLWMVDYRTKKQWCLINCSQQRQKVNRYYSYHIARQNGIMTSARIVDFFGGLLPKYLIIPSHIGGVPVKFVHKSGRRNPYSGGITALCIPDTVKVIDDFAFSDTLDIISRIVYLGKGGVINSLSFATASVHSIILPESLEYVGSASFLSPNLEHVILPEGTRMRVDTILTFPTLESIQSVDTWGKCPHIIVKGASPENDLNYDLLKIIAATQKADFISHPDVVLDEWKKCPLDWEQFLLLIHQGYLRVYDSFDLSIGREFSYDTNESITFTKDTLKKYPILQFCTCKFISAFSRDCKIYLKNNTLSCAMSNEIDRIYTQDIVDFLRYCINELQICVTRAEFYDARDLLEIASCLLYEKKELLQQETIHEINGDIQKAQDILSAHMQSH